jgi:ribonuclease E
MLIPAPVGDMEGDEEPDVVDADDEDDDAEDDTEEQRAADGADGTGGGDEAERRRKRRRRRRRGGRRDDQPGGGDASSEPAEAGSPGPAANDDTSDSLVAAEAEAPAEPEEGGEPGEAAAASDDDPRNRRRGRRGGRRRRRDGDGELSPFSVPGADQPDLAPVYAGPTPADPFGGRAFDIFDVMDQVERAAEAKPAPRLPSASEIVNATAPEAEATFAETPVAEPAAEAGTAEVEPDIVNGGAPEPIAVALPPAEIKADESAHDDAAVGEQVNGSGETAEGDEIVNVDAPPAAPLIRPILIGSDGESPGEKKRGWWRR